MRTAALADDIRRERPDLEGTHLVLQIYLMRLGVIVDRAFEELSRSLHGLSGYEMRVLLALRRAGPPFQRRPTDLFRTLLISSGAITKQVDRLQASGFVIRSSDPSFSGGYLIRLTKKGQRAADDVLTSLDTESILAQGSRAVSYEDLRPLVRACETLLAALEDTGTGDEAEDP